MSASARSARAGLVLAIVSVALSASPARAQDVVKKLNRPFNQCTHPSTYVANIYDPAFFTATGTETTLTFSRTHVACSQRCAPNPIPGGQGTSCDQFCIYNDVFCPYNWKCSSCSAPGCLGYCVGGVDVVVGYAVVMKASRYCSIAACAALSVNGCPPTSCDNSGTCADATSNAKALCMCPDPACPMSGYICNGTRPVLPAADVALEAFNTATNPAWNLGYATITSNVLHLDGSDLPTSLAQVRFATTPGEQYAVLIEWSIYPPIFGFQNCPDASLLFSIDSRPDTCGP